MKILDRLYDDFKVYDENLELTSWLPQKDYNFYVELLSNREDYEYLFENFGKHKISEGLNCSTFHKFCTYEKFDFYMEELKKIFNENSKHLNINELGLTIFVNYKEKILVKKLSHPHFISMD